MDEINEILGTTTKTNNYSTNRNYNNYQKKNSWKEKQAQDRQEIYDTMDRMALIVSNDSEKFKQYLDVQSNFTKYSVGNCLVILEKAPNSTQIKDKASWAEKDISLVQNPKAIKILEPSKSEKSNRIFYNPKEVFDISQTNAPKQEKITNYKDEDLLRAFLNHCDVPRKAVEKLANGTIGSEYNRDENVLYVCKRMDRELLFQTLSQELANIEMRDEEQSNIKSFKSYCISYMICKKYGIDVSNYNFENLPEEISNQKEPKDIRAEIDKIRINYEKLDSKIADYFEMNSKEKKKSVPER